VYKDISQRSPRGPSRARDKQISLNIVEGNNRLFKRIKHSASNGVSKDASTNDEVISPCLAPLDGATDEEIAEYLNARRFR
jgi:hypothetical protein